MKENVNNSTQQEVGKDPEEEVVKGEKRLVPDEKETTNFLSTRKPF